MSLEHAEVGGGLFTENSVVIVEGKSIDYEFVCESVSQTSIVRKGLRNIDLS